MAKSFAFIVENTISVWCVVTPGWAFKLVSFGKCHVKTPHGHRYGDILALYDMPKYFSAVIDTNFVLTRQYTVSAYNFSCRICYLDIKPWMSSYPILCNTDMQRVVSGDSGTGTSSYWVMPSNTAIWISLLFRDRAMAGLIEFRFLWWCLRWCCTDLFHIFQNICDITFWLSRVSILA